jgi:hypothetical protein
MKLKFNSHICKYERLEVNERLCFNCSKLGINVVEDEKHVVLQCPGYADIRQSILYNICELNGIFKAYKSHS